MDARGLIGWLYEQRAPGRTFRTSSISDKEAVSKDSMPASISQPITAGSGFALTAYMTSPEKPWRNCWAAARMRLGNRQKTGVSVVFCRSSCSTLGYSSRTRQVLGDPGRTAAYQRPAGDARVLPGVHRGSDR